jgi:hypothetical protein
MGTRGEEADRNPTRGERRAGVEAAGPCAATSVARTARTAEPGRFAPRDEGKNGDEAPCYKRSPGHQPLSGPLRPASLIRRDPDPRHLL